MEHAKMKAEVLLPLDNRLADFAERMSELLGDLQRVEERPRLSILEDVEATGCDVYRFRESPRTPFVGTIGIEEGAHLVSLARDLLLHGAMAEHSPTRRSLSGRRPDEVADFMKRALLGQTEASSFVVRAQVQVPEVETEDMFPEHVEPATEPFERRAGVRMMSVLGDTREAASEAIRTRDFRPFSELLREGATISLYSTLAEANDVAPTSPLEITSSWAPSRPVVGRPPASVTFEPELVDPIREAARILAPPEPAHGARLVGDVELLHRSAQEELIGELALHTKWEGRFRKVHFFLERPDYDLAIQAFAERAPFTVVGDLVKKGNRWWLDSPREAAVIGSEESE